MSNASVDLGPEPKPRRRPQRMRPKPPEVIDQARNVRSALSQYTGNHSRVSAALRQITAAFVDTLENRLFKKAVIDEDFNSLKLAVGAKGGDRDYAGGSAAAASADPATGAVVRLVVQRLPSGYFFTKRPGVLLNLAVAAESEGASEDELRALGRTKRRLACCLRIISHD
jgi:hypothetical protein